jgi:hypothetical protein
MSSCRARPDGEELPMATVLGAGEDSADDKRRTVSFEVDIKPILGDNCVNCHNRETMPERISFERKEWAMEPMGGSPVIIPGVPQNSRLIHAVTSPDTAERAMPPVGHRIPKQHVELLKRWIAEGAYWPEGPSGIMKPLEIPTE